MIELPPAIDNIYATNDVVNASRFNNINASTSNSISQLMPLVAKQTFPNSIRRVEEVNTVSVSQPDQHQQLGKINQLNRNNSQHKGIEILGRRNHLNAEVYASQSNLISK